MMLTQELEAVVSDIKDDLSNGEAGTDTTLFDKNQTGVISAIGSTDIALSDIQLSGTTINMTYLLSTSLANGSDITEYDVNNGDIAYLRIVKPATTKTSQDELTMLHTLDFAIVI